MFSVAPWYSFASRLAIVSPGLKSDQWIAAAPALERGGRGGPGHAASVGATPVRHDRRHHPVTGPSPSRRRSPLRHRFVTELQPTRSDDAGTLARTSRREERDLEA